MKQNYPRPAPNVYRFEHPGTFSEYSVIPSRIRQMHYVLLPGMLPILAIKGNKKPGP
jgi:hypothetical protein